MRLIEFYLTYSAIIPGKSFVISSIEELSLSIGDNFKSEELFTLERICKYNFPVSMNHGDFSSENIIVNGNNQLFLLDLETTNIEYHGNDIAQFIFSNLEDLKKRLNAKLLDLITYSINKLYADYTDEFKNNVVLLFIFEGLKTGTQRTKNANKSYYTTYKNRLDEYVNLLSELAMNE